MTPNLEHTDDLNRTIDRDFEKLSSVVIRTGEQSAEMRYGTAVVSWPGGSSDSDPTTVTHGLGSTPLHILFGSGSANTAPGWSSPTATTFVITARTVDGSSPASPNNRSISWLAIG